MSNAEERRRATRAVSPLVLEELQLDRQFHPNLGGVTKGGLANHFPMTMLALHGLGASDDEVRAFKATWPRHRATISGDVGLVDRGLLTAENWPAFLGDGARFPEFRRVFESLLEGARGLDTVPWALAIMQDALPMGLFHPLIRLTFAVEQGDRGLIADALAYMAIRHEDLFRTKVLGRADAAEVAGSPASVWRRLSTNDEVWRATRAIQAGSIRICEELCAAPAVHRAALPQDFPTGTLPVRMPEVCALALRLYLFAPSLTTLHAVTAAQALADLTLRFGAEAATFSALWARYWVWLTALYLEKGRPEGLPTANPDAASSAIAWDALAARARAVPEVHLIKMAYSCRWLDETFGPEPLYRLAVANMLAEQRAHPRHGAGIASAPV